MSVHDDPVHAEPPPVARPADDYRHPPFIRTGRIRRPASRWWAAVICAGSACVLGVAISLPPDPSGMGTHRRMGLAPCGMLVTTGLPCPTCGMTTSFSEMMHGHPLRSVIAQPAGALMCLGAIAACLLGAWTAATGRCLVIDWYRVSPTWLAFTIGAFFFLGWGAKVLIGLADGTLPYHG